MISPLPPQNDYKIHGLFPSPVYIATRNSDLDPTEKIEIEDIIKEGTRQEISASTSNDTYIFNGKLKKIKQFCEQQLKIYVEQVMNPKEELDFYITQSWLNIIKPGKTHAEHWHPNSIISGVFYISTEEDDSIKFVDPNFKIRGIIKLKQNMKEYFQQ